VGPWPRARDRTRLPAVACHSATARRRTPPPCPFVDSCGHLGVCAERRALRGQGQPRWGGRALGRRGPGPPSPSTSPTSPTPSLLPVTTCWRSTSRSGCSFSPLLARRGPDWGLGVFLFIFGAALWSTLRRGVVSLSPPLPPDLLALLGRDPIRVNVSVVCSRVLVCRLSSVCY